MSLLTEWRALSENLETQEAEIKFWEEYLKVEAGIYNELLNKNIIFSLKASIKQIVAVGINNAFTKVINCSLISLSNNSFFSYKYANFSFKSILQMLCFLCDDY